MKKLFIIMTLFTSSFFLFFEDVKAAEYTYDFSGLEKYVDNDVYPLVKAKAIEVLENNSDIYNKYLIYCNSSTYYIIFFNTEDNPNIILKESYFIYDHTYAYTCYFTSDGINFTDKDLTRFSQMDSSSTYFLYNSSSVSTSTSFDKITFIMNDFVYEILSGDNFIFLEDLYNKSLDLDESDLHQEELEKVSNFYTVVIDKLVYLSEVLVSNYIYLSIIVIFMLVFLFKLIFRRYL